MTTTSAAQHNNQLRYLVVVAVIFAIGYWLSRIALDRGWLPHTDLASVEFPNADWQVGQYASCVATRLNAQSVTLDCSGSGRTGEARDTYVRFFGRVTENSTEFSCQRGSAVITCRLRRNGYAVPIR
jgi:hypothetical protein